jgi:hypothetical protein
LARVTVAQRCGHGFSSGVHNPQLGVGSGRDGQHRADIGSIPSAGSAVDVDGGDSRPSGKLLPVGGGLCGEALCCSDQGRGGDQCNGGHSHGGEGQQEATA